MKASQRRNTAASRSRLLGAATLVPPDIGHCVGIDRIDAPARVAKQTRCSRYTPAVAPFLKSILVTYFPDLTRNKQ